MAPRAAFFLQLWIALLGCAQAETSSGSSTILPQLSLSQLYQTLFVANSEARATLLASLASMSIRDYYDHLLAGTDDSEFKVGEVTVSHVHDALTQRANTYSMMDSAYGSLEALWHAGGFDPAAPVSEADFVTSLQAALTRTVKHEKTNLGLLTADFNAAQSPSGHQLIAFKISPMVYPDAALVPKDYRVVAAYYHRQGGSIVAAAPVEGVENAENSELNQYFRNLDAVVQVNGVDALSGQDQYGNLVQRTPANSPGKTSPVYNYQVSNGDSRTNFIHAGELIHGDLYVVRRQGPK